MPASQYHTLLACRTDSQSGAGTLLTWYIQEAWHRKWRETRASWGKHVPVAAALPGVTHLLWLPCSHRVQGKAAADSGAPGPNTSAVKHHPLANKLHSVPLISGFHLRMCTKRGLVSRAHVHKVSFYANLLQGSVLCIYDINEQHAPL